MEELKALLAAQNKTYELIKQLIETQKPVDIREQINEVVESQKASIEAQKLLAASLDRACELSRLEPEEIKIYKQQVAVYKQSIEAQREQFERQLEAQKEQFEAQREHFKQLSEIGELNRLNQAQFGAFIAQSNKLLNLSVDC